MLKTVRSRAVRSPTSYHWSNVPAGPESLQAVGVPGPIQGIATRTSEQFEVARYRVKAVLVRQEIDADADQDGGGPAAVVDVFLEEEFAGNGVGDQR